MKPYRVQYTPEAAARIHKLHPQIEREIRETIRTFLNAPLIGRPFQLDLFGYWAYRVRSHRVIYSVNEEDGTLDVVFVGFRRNVYEALRILLPEQRYRH